MVVSFSMICSGICKSMYKKELIDIHNNAISTKMVAWGSNKGSIIAQEGMKRKGGCFMIWPCHSPLEVPPFLLHASLQVVPSIFGFYVCSKYKCHILGKKVDLMQENSFHYIFHACYKNDHSMRKAFVDMKTRQAPMLWGSFPLVVMVVIAKNRKCFLCAFGW